MRCPNCGSEMLPFAVPPQLAEYLPEQPRHVAACTTCLTVVPTDEEPVVPPEFSRVSTHLPEDPAAAVPLLVAIGLLDHLALYREEITELLQQVERAGTDPMLVLERLDADPSIEPGFDLDRRIDQLLQLYE